MKFLIIILVFCYFRLTNSGYSYDGGLGSDCLYDEDCITRNSFCKGNKVCSCKIGYQYDAGSDVCFPKEINLKCNEDYDCSALLNAKCINGYCQCKMDYVSSRDKSACLPSMRLTSWCEEDVQCNSVMNKSFCNPALRQCVCLKGFKLNNFRMQCQENKKLGSPCLNTEECEGDDENYGKVECKSKNSLLKVCSCKDGYYEENLFCYAENGSSQAIVIKSSMAWLVVSFALVLYKI